MNTVEQLSFRASAFLYIILNLFTVINIHEFKSQF